MSRKGWSKPEPAGEKAPARAQATANIGFEKQLWDMANALRGNLDAARYKDVVLGLIFLKYVSDAFEERRKQLELEREDGADPEHPDEYLGWGVFWVAQEARWSNLAANANSPNIGQLIDRAIVIAPGDILL